VQDNRIIGRSFYHANLKPQILKTTVIPAKQALIKVYMEAYAKADFMTTINGGGAGGGFAAVIADRHLLGIDGGFNMGLARAPSAEVTLRYGHKISFKR
jgi:hypothetical protein